uniref:nucleolar protein 14-like n=1 Tax=Styela clava TaxID=7725 RepID=UPI00193A2413|nr:nucleolar protein 14-like [Styela clava]
MGKPKKGIADKVRKAKQAKKKNVFKVHSNPFEVKINKQKHNIMGRKTKHDRGLPGVSRSKANKKRKDTLLKEYKDRFKTNNLMDERFGEGRTDLSVEDKMLERFAMEKKRKHDKMSLFNLNDDEEELTHFGQSLAEIKDFGSHGQSDDEDNGVISGEYVSEAHFGGGIFRKKSSNEENDDEDESMKPKSRKEIIDEIILKSKKAKHEKQTTQEEANDLREKLDDTWQEVEKLLKSSTRSTKDKEFAKDTYKPDEYDVFVRQMQYDKKAAPAQRGKTEAEKAAEESARIRKLEDDRIERMKEDYNHVTKKSAQTHRSADDLNYDFLPEKVYVEPVSYKDGVMVVADDSKLEDENNNDWQLDVKIDDEIEASESEEDEEDEEQLSEDNSDEDEFSDIVTDDEDVEYTQTQHTDAEMMENMKKKQSKMKEQKETAEIKGSSKFPKSYFEFCDMVDTKYSGSCQKCLSALRKFFSTGLAKGNKEKMATLFEYVWQKIYDVCIEKELKMEAVDNLVRHLYELCQLNPLSSAKYIVNEMKNIYKMYLLRNGKIRIPDFAHLIQFKLIKILFSTSDYFHSVCSPAILFMCHILHSTRPTNLRDVSSLLFVCTLMFEYVCFSKRFIPECINMLCGILCMALPRTIQQSKGIPSAASLYLNTKNCQLLVLEGQSLNNSDDRQKPDLIKCLSIKDPCLLNTDETRLQMLNVALKLSLKFVMLNSQISCFKEIHQPLKIICSRCISGYRATNEGKVHPLAELLYEVKAEVERIEKKSPDLKHLVQSESNKPKALPLYDPKFEEVGEPFQKGSRKQTSSTKREKDRLQHRYKRELKGAVREIKKDARFIAREQLNEQIEKDKERAAKVKRLYGFLSNQEGEVKKINRKRFKLGVD